jgi:hypothetical protein
MYRTEQWQVFFIDPGNSRSPISISLCLNPSIQGRGFFPVLGGVSKRKVYLDMTNYNNS